MFSKSAKQFYNRLDKTNISVIFKTGRTITVSALGVDTIPSNKAHLRESSSSGLVQAWNIEDRCWESFDLGDVAKMQNLNFKRQLLAE